MSASLRFDLSENICMLLAEIKTTDFDPKKKYTFVVSLGSTEQHGPFLPLGTDTYCHDAIVKKAHKHLSEVIFLPTIPITCSKEHKGFPGTVWLQKDTLYSVLRDICDSLKEYARNIVFISWHGGNLGLLDKFIAVEQKDFIPVRLYHLRMRDKETDKKTKALIKGPIDEHAGNTEISMILAINSKLVQKPSAKKHPKHNFNHDWEKHYVIENSPDGVVDKHPRWVISKKIGKDIIALHAKLLIREIKKIDKKNNFR